VSPASKAESAAALKMVFNHLPADIRAKTIKSLLSAAARGEISFDGLLVARQGGQLRGAVWARVSSGRIASVWPPRICRGAPEDTISPLLDAMDRFLKAKDARVAQAVVDPHDQEGAGRLEADGYHASTDLLYLTCLRDRFPMEEPASRLEFEPYCPNQQRRLTNIVCRTYDGTYDFPELNETCEAEDVLAGYRETGVHDPNVWLFVRERGRDVGCLLLTDHPQDRQFELLYMGLVPEARGRCRGIDVTRHALWLTAQAGRPQIVLGVDAANEPAIRMYQRAGFTPLDRKRVMLKLLNARQ
jgi:ribosomal protein S18 acetylase RimI-like enzyme